MTDHLYNMEENSIKLLNSWQVFCDLVIVKAVPDRVTSLIKKEQSSYFLEIVISLQAWRLFAAWLQGVYLDRY